MYIYENISVSKSGELVPSSPHTHTHTHILSLSLSLSLCHIHAHKLFYIIAVLTFQWLCCPQTLQLLLVLYSHSSKEKKPFYFCVLHILVAAISATPDRTDILHKRDPANLRSFFIARAPVACSFSKRLVHERLRNASPVGWFDPY